VSDPKIKVAVLGGGVGSMVTAFYLTSTPALRARYDVTVYQMGWRIGGKGASGRNRAFGDRIEEHGLHIWMGFYENAFRAMRAAYAEADRPPSVPIRTIDDAFKKHSYIVLQEQLVEGGNWYPWTFDFPTNDDVPGLGKPLPSVLGYAEMLAKWMLQFWLQSPLAQELEAAAEEAFEALPDWLERAIEGAWERGQQELSQFFEAIGLGSRASSQVVSLLERIVRLVSALPADPADHSARDHQILVALIRAFMRLTWRILERRVDTSFEAHKLWVSINLAGSALCGILADGIAIQGWDSIDDLDLRAWLAQHGANATTVNSAPIRGVYDLAFGYLNGDTRKGSFAAGSAMRGMLRMMLTYKGAIFFKMQAGMGDIVFSPFYEALKKRGVSFKFFHRIDRLELTPNQSAIARIKGTRQVKLVDESKEYNPLIITPDGLPCWPSEPSFDQIVDGAELKASGINLESSWAKPWKDEAPFELEFGKDFDLVVLGISIAAFPFLCKELIDANSRFRKMVEKVQTVNTQAMQLWLKPDLDGLGWKRPPGIKEHPVLGSFVEPIDTWADMHQLLPREFWPPGQEPGSIAYFCGPYEGQRPAPPFSDHGYPAQELAAYRTMAVDFLEKDVRVLWPNTVSPSGGFDWDALIDPQERSGIDRFQAQYIRVNVDPSERYVLSVPKSTFYRLKPGDSGFSNLVMAGDWTYNVINAGCVEAAVSSGMAASRSICGVPAQIIGEHDR
jgi:uncharacterized protein with NAD-binding domain and iron-sulfur cluster